MNSVNDVFNNSILGKKVVNGDLVMYSNEHQYVHACGLVYDGVIYGIDYRHGKNAQDQQLYEAFDVTNENDQGKYTYVVPVTPNSVEQTVMETAKAYIRDHGVVLAHTHLRPMCDKCTNIPGHVYIPLADSHHAVLYLGKGSYVKMTGDDALVTDKGHVYVRLAMRMPTRMLDYDRTPLTKDDLLEAADVSVVGEQINSVNNGVKLTNDKSVKLMADLGQLIDVNGTFNVMVDGNVVGMFIPAETAQTPVKQTKTKPVPPAGMQEFTVRVDLDYATYAGSHWKCALTADDPFVSTNMPSMLANVNRHVTKQLGSPLGLQHTLSRYIKPEGKVVNVEYDIPDMTTGVGTVGVIVTYWAKSSMSKLITELVHTEKGNGHSKFHYYGQTYVHVFVVRDDAA
jgi:hypothetical protein